MTTRPLSGAYLEGAGTVSLVREDDGLAARPVEQDASTAMLALLAFYLGGPVVGAFVLLVVILPRARRHVRLRIAWDEVAAAHRASQTYVLRRTGSEPVVLHVREFHVARLDAWLAAALGDRFDVRTPDELRPLLPVLAAPRSVDDEGPGFLARLFRPRSHAVVTGCLLAAAVAGALARWGGAPTLATQLVAVSCLAAGVLAGWIDRGLRYADDRQRERLLRRGVRPVGPVPCGVRQSGHLGAALWPFVRGDAAPHALGLRVVARPLAGPETVFAVGLALLAALGGHPVLPLWLWGLAALSSLLAIELPGRRAEREVLRREDVAAIESGGEVLRIVRPEGEPVELRPVAERRADLLALLQRALPDAEVRSPRRVAPEAPPDPAQLDESLARLRSLQDR